MHKTKRKKKHKHKFLDVAFVGLYEKVKCKEDKSKKIREVKRMIKVKREI